MVNTNLKYIGQPWRGRSLTFGPYAGALLVLLILPFIMPGYLQGIMTRILIMAVFAIGLDLIMGYVGLISLGHAAYFGVAAYTTGILATRYGIESFWVVLPAAIIFTAVAAIILGFLALRVSGVYFVLVTFATSELLRSIAVKWYSLTKGDDGLPGIIRPSLGIPLSLVHSINYYYFVLIIFVICFFLLYRIVNSPFGHALQGIRDDERRMRALGYNTWIYKYIAFIISAVFVGVAGVLFTYFNGLVYPSMIGVLGTIEPLIMVMIGGAGTLFGPALGSALVILVEYFASIYSPDRWPLIEGAIFILVIMFFREGIGVRLRNFWKRVRYRYAGSES